MNLEVGMYVRCKNRNIARVEKIDKVYPEYLNKYYFDNVIGTMYVSQYYYPSAIYECNHKDVDIYILKASHNIIDLIEVGDYVNGYKIYSIYDDDKYVNEYNLKHKKCLGKNIYDEDYQEYLIYEEDIETIATKEQFEALAYKVN